MKHTEKKREFSMKYCPNLEDHVVVMMTGEGHVKNKVCLSSHLCRSDSRMSCGHEQPQTAKKEEAVFF